MWSTCCYTFANLVFLLKSIFKAGGRKPLQATFLINVADKGESQTPAMEIIAFGELLIIGTVEGISNVLRSFTFDGNVLFCKVYSWLATPLWQRFCMIGKMHVGPVPLESLRY
jgi:hypothetical protein